MLLLYHSHKHISYPIRTIARSAITHDIYRTINNLVMQKKLIISSIGVTIHKVAPPVPSVHGGVFFTYRNALQE
ncbi:hypothetical protein [Wolbachia pipientis]|uniref:hypothetical protein n=1 Tax=Wolbachia pipientis TaxID=955 RepID=UPI0021750930|nr:hypothetical protein [Wolbachia pipientis]